MAARLAPIILTASALLLTSCNRGFGRFAFAIDTGSSAAPAQVALRESPGLPAEREGTLEPAAGSEVTPVYRLSRAALVPRAGLAFVIGYRSDITSCDLAILDDHLKPLSTVELPPTGANTWRLQIPIASGARIGGFRVAARAAAGRLELSSAGIEPHIVGFSLASGALTQDGSVAVRSAGPASLSARISSAARAEMERGTWQLAIELGGSGEAEVALTATGGQTRTLEVASSASRLVRLHPGSVGFVPRDLAVRLSREADGLAVRSATITQLAAGEPIRADPGLILAWQRSRWRQQDYELFSWDRLPKVLIFDTASYEVQERFFRRLAFFVEKPDTAGRVPTLEEVAGRRSWNAHDYRSEDLARFFTAAARQGGPLLREEEELRSILLANTIIEADGDGYRPKAGAVLSISRSSYTALRELLLNHECFHGAFFSLPGFREASARAWQALSPSEREIWLSFFELKGYNTADPYLMANEFQSYLFQQKRSEVPQFQAVTLQRVQAAFPGRQAAVRRLLADRPDSFLASFDELERALLDEGGPPGGEAAGVTGAAQ